jgi:RNA polymerase sigma-70 factor (ECF subfamily)
MSDDYTIIKRVTEGDIESFGLLVDKYRRPVIRMVRNIAGVNHLSEDISQDVFMRAFQKLASFDPALSRFSTWLFTIARNLALNAFKKRTVPTASALPETPDRSLPHDNLIRNEFFEKLDEALETLPMKLRTAFILSQMEELSHAEVAQIEGIRIGTVKSRISRAKDKLRSVLARTDGDKIND